MRGRRFVGGASTLPAHWLATPAARAAALAAAAALVANLFVPAAGPAVVGLIVEPWDKLVHLAYFFVLAVLLSIADAGRRTFLTAAIAVVVGAADEWNQTFMPERAASLGDLFADCLGAVAGAAAARRLTRRVAGAR